MGGRARSKRVPLAGCFAPLSDRRTDKGRWGVGGFFFIRCVVVTISGSSDFPLSTFAYYLCVLFVIRRIPSPSTLVVAAYSIRASSDLL
jgi:hypothetical protein